jgi:hypothetical protein
LRIHRVQPAALINLKRISGRGTAGGESAVHGENRAARVRGQVRSQEHDRRGDLLVWRPPSMFLYISASDSRRQPRFGAFHEIDRSESTGPDSLTTRTPASTLVEPSARERHQARVGAAAGDSRHRRAQRCRRR